MKVITPCGGPWNELINLNFCNLAWIIALFVAPLVTHSVRDRESEKITLSWNYLNKYLWGNLAWVRFPLVERARSLKVNKSWSKFPVDSLINNFMWQQRSRHNATTPKKECVDDSGGIEFQEETIQCWESTAEWDEVARTRVEWQVTKTGGSHVVAVDVVVDCLLIIMLRWSFLTSRINREAKITFTQDVKNTKSQQQCYRRVSLLCCETFSASRNSFLTQPMATTCELFHRV